MQGFFSFYEGQFKAFIEHARYIYTILPQVLAPQYFFNERFDYFSNLHE